MALGRPPPHCQPTTADPGAAPQRPPQVQELPTGLLLPQAGSPRLLADGGEGDPPGDTFAPALDGDLDAGTSRTSSIRPPGPLGR
jgi:hypothetical protein